MSARETQTRELLAKIWEKNQPLFHERMAVLDAAATAAADGSLSAELRASAIDEAHKLAGSLGMFGYLEGTDLARHIEIALEAGDTAGLRDVVAALRVVVSRPFAKSVAGSTA